MKNMESWSLHKNHSHNVVIYITEKCAKKVAKSFNLLHYSIKLFANVYFFTISFPLRSFNPISAFIYDYTRKYVKY